MKNNKWLHLIAVLCIATLTACGGGGGGGGGAGGTSTGGGTGTPAAGSEGTLTSPVVLAANTPYSGTVSANGPSYYLFNGLTAGATYSVTLGNVAGSIIPFFYSSNTQANGQNCFYSALSATSSCIVQASTTGSVLVVISNFSVSGSSSYNLNATLALDAGQGTPTTPVAIAGLASYTGALTSGVSTTTYDPGNSGYYMLTGLTAGHRYAISLAASAGSAMLLAYQSSYAAQACATLAAAGGTASCSITAKGTSLLLQASARDAASFTISTVDTGAVAPFLPQGSAGSPIALTLDAPLPLNNNGSVDDTKSYYTVSRLVPGQAYYAYLKNLTDNVDLYVYRDAAYSQLACSSTRTSTQAEDCTATVGAAGQLWLVADGSKAQANLGSNFTIGLQRAAPVQGTSALPQAVNSATELPFRVSAGNITTSYYKVTGLAPNTTVLATLATERFIGGTYPTLAVHPATGFSAFPACQNAAVYGACNGTTNAAGELFVTVDYGYGFPPGGTAYLDVKPLPVSEGTATAPLAKDMAALTNQFTGQVATGYSYYALTGLTPNASYYILTSFGAGQSAQTSVYTAFTGDLSTQTAACSSSWSYINTGCTATADATGKLWVGIGGWYTTAGTTFKIEALAAPVVQGTQAAPVNITVPYRSNGGGYYMVTGLTPGSEYLFRKSGDSGSAGFLVYNDTSYTSQVCTPVYSTYGRESFCRGKPTGSTVYLTAVDTGYMATLGNMTLDVTPVPVAEGTAAAPVAINAVGTRAGSVNVGVSYYKATLAANTAYTVGLTGVSGDPDLHVYNNAAMTGAATCMSLNGTNKSETCSVTSDSAGNLWIMVDGELSKGGANYQLQIN